MDGLKLSAKALLNARHAYPLRTVLSFARSAEKHSAKSCFPSHETIASARRLPLPRSGLRRGRDVPSLHLPAGRRAWDFVHSGRRVCKRKVPLPDNGKRCWRRTTEKQFYKIRVRRTRRRIQPAVPGLLRRTLPPVPMVRGHRARGLYSKQITRNETARFPVLRR